MISSVICAKEQPHWQIILFLSLLVVLHILTISLLPANPVMTGRTIDGLGLQLLRSIGEKGIRMSVIWEDPPPSSARAARFGKEPSPLRKEADDILETLSLHQGTWARIWDLETKDEARKRSNYIGTKNYSFSVRETQYGWSVYGRFNGEPEPEPDPEPQPEPSPEDPAASREATF
jgi:hypothetical protein